MSFSVRPTDNVGSATIRIEEAWTVPRLNLPAQKVTKSMIQSWPHVSDIEVSEVDSHDLTMLIGANAIDAFAQYEIRQGSSGTPAAVLTSFGRTLTGSVKNFVPPEQLHCMFVHKIPSAEDFLHEQVQNW